MVGGGWHAFSTPAAVLCSEAGSLERNFSRSLPSGLFVLQPAGLPSCGGWSWASRFAARAGAGGGGPQPGPGEPPYSPPPSLSARCSRESPASFHSRKREVETGRAVGSAGVLPGVCTVRPASTGQMCHLVAVTAGVHGVPGVQQGHCSLGPCPLEVRSPGRQTPLTQGISCVYT